MKTEILIFYQAIKNFVESKFNALDDVVVKKKYTTGLLKNDGTVDTNTYLQTSQTSGLVKNDGTIDTTQYLSSHQDITGKADKTGGASQITDPNSNLYNYIGNLNAGATQQDINNALNTIIGSLLSVDLVEVTSNKGTASASTMNKLYLVPEATAETNDAYEIFITVRTGTSPNYTYNWEKIDKVRIDLSNYIQTSNTVGYVKNDGTIDNTNYTKLTNMTTETITITYDDDSTETLTLFVQSNQQSNDDDEGSNYPVGDK